MNIVIVGSGNIAGFYLHHFSALNHNVTLWGRNATKTEKLAQTTHVKIASSLSDAIKDADLILLAVSDNAISEIAAQIPKTEACIVHTSGSINIDVLNQFNNRGVFYPLQTVNPNVPYPNKNQFPILIEANSTALYRMLYDLAFELTEKVEFVNSHTREKYHLAAVFAANFTNQLLQIAQEILMENELEFSLLQPLMQQQISNSFSIGPIKAQTGPAKRKDTEVLAKHKRLLTAHPEWQKLYQIVSELISVNAQ